MKYNTLLAGSILLFLLGCNAGTDERQKNASPYFDLKGYFEKEANRLTKASPAVRKTVGINGFSETKTLKIADWKRELSSISNADINKASWRGAFRIIRSENKVMYRSDDRKVPVKELCIFYRDTIASGFLVLIRNSNALYTSTDSLIYYPDSLYRIKKNQQIKLLSEKNYEITIKFR
ncbi:MAG TPA: hypothetical protein VK541_23455 [Pedobacter sp.]|uniref:hypothetical protein n=1 Tax=Pedobacter sp. TaxID=1411316 RepID=UPI002D0F6419|nr:hypothetical protein [Pedobacter sp.]HMI05465.1 hypothetical protein [Pedobacter sp.]